ncbi:MAG TPA: aminomethyl-transferring glycine dehydrogenase subunit GcvPA [Candidatus Competibacteraceae bacterium]|nr:aminomethyl-transferring glycine dehydrogenase subunit GcvPA [Candidatus Competibacteraceae bacterium]MCP5132994.1 aminomethyl-transferring glycine dehydrogenase subunit GcvPA [Gammaproteobacteria bacterium]HRY17252.1 aminomethyl-transferring glycine dehydrogenase subunit GcvPA [Candidatus Competibacteraceae bacterium]
MPFIPHTLDDVRVMLDAIDVPALETLFDEIPPSLRISELPALPDALTEWQVSRLMTERAAELSQPLCFLGAGAYEHHTPAAVWEIAGRGEFYSAYTPYQPEASQGTLQVLYEYQSMMAGLTGMAVSNASLYDGASALAEALLMAVRANRKSKSKRVLVPRTLHPFYRKAVRSIVHNQDIELVILPYDPSGGHTLQEALVPYAGQDFAALVIPQPNFFGVLEDVDELTDWAHHHDLLAVAVVNPTTLAVLKPPGEWGQTGADITCGDGQPFGSPLNSGGPYFGFLCCRKELVRQMPGRLVGRTVDLDEKHGFTLTLQAREQHIRRSKATSNICTNQGLMVTAATLYLSLLGPHGLEQVAAICHANTRMLVELLSAIPGVSQIFNRPMFHEAVLKLPHPASEILDGLLARGILGGFDLSSEYPELGNALLVCATETRTEADLRQYAEALAMVV